MVKRAKLEVGVSYAVQPAPAVLGSPGRILCFGEVPPFLCESVLIGPENVDRYESVLAALRFWLTAPEGAQGSITEAAWLSGVMGCEVTLAFEDKSDLYLPNETGGLRFG